MTEKHIINLFFKLTIWTPYIFLLITNITTTKKLAQIGLFTYLNQFY